MAQYKPADHVPIFCQKFSASDQNQLLLVEDQNPILIQWRPENIIAMNKIQRLVFCREVVVRDQLWVDEGLTSVEKAERKLQPYARRYRVASPQPTEQAIQQSRARYRSHVEQIRLQGENDVLRGEQGRHQDEINRRVAQLIEKDAILEDLKNNHEGKIKQMKNDRKSKEADYKELQEQLRTLENENEITKEKLRVTTENLQETNDNRQKLLEEIKTKDREISSLQKQINELENPDSKVYLQLADKLIDNNKEELLLDHIREGRKLKQNTDFYENGLTALLHTGCDPDDITSTLCEINKKSIGVPKEKYDTDIKEETDRSQRERALLVEDHRVARDESAANNTALQRVFVDNIAELKINIAELKNRLSVEEGKHHATEKNLADVQLKYDALKDETATESQLRTELETEKEKNQVLEGKNTELKLNLKLAYQEQDGDE